MKTVKLFSILACHRRLKKGATVMGIQTTHEDLLLRLGSLEQQQAEWSAERHTLIKEKEELELQVNILEQKYAECCTERESLLTEKSEFIALFESIDAGIYAIDPDTNEILYANKRARNAFRGKNLVGKKCYRALQGLDLPCDFCNHPQVFRRNLGKAHIFEVQNNLNKKWYHCIAKAIKWPASGKMVRWEMAICIHNQKVAVEALEESEIKYATLVENAKDCITIVQDGIRKYANRAMAKLLECQMEEIVGQPYLDVVSEEYRNQFKDLSKLTREDSNNLELHESTLVSKTGKKIDVEIAFTEIIYENKPAFMGLIRDVSKRKRMQESLRQSEQRYGVLLDYLNSHIPLHVGASDEDYIFIFWNKYSGKMLGYTADEVEGKMSPAFIHETDEDVEEVLRVTQAGDVFDKEINFVHKNGTLVPVHCVVVPMRSADGDLVGLYGFAEDITHRKQAEKVLKESEKQFRSLVEHSPICISIVQDGGKVAYANPEQKKAFGFTSQQMTLTNVHKRIHPADLKAIFQKIKKKLEESDPDFIIDITYRFYKISRKKRSGLRWFQTRLTQIQYQGSLAVLLNTVDITEAKQIQQLLDIEDKMTSLGRVAAGIAHEVRSPLTAITLFLNNLDLICSENERIEDEVLDETREIITESLEAAQNIETVVKRVIDFSKPSVTSKSPTPLNQPIYQALKLSEATLKKDISLHRNLATNSQVFFLDVQRLKQVFLNLITNSIQAMQDMDGPRHLLVESEIKSNNIIYRISDSGPGVSVTHREKIFDPFFTTKSDGSGIGLSISHRIITDHQGTIGVSRSKWDGAEFTIRIPNIKQI